MRFCLALFLNLGLITSIGCEPKPEYPEAKANTVAATDTAPPPPPAEMTNWTQFVVPSMKSIKDDWPKVEAAVKAQPGVKEVRYKPTDGDTVPEGIALIKHTKEFDSKKLAEVLAEAGYEGASAKAF